MRRLVPMALIGAAVAIAFPLTVPMLAAQTTAGRPADVRGDWEGDYTTTIGVFRNTISFLTEDFATGEVTGTANAAVDVIAGTVVGNTITWTSTRPGYTASSQGTVSADGSKITGDLGSDSNGTTGTFELNRTSAPPGATAAPQAGASAPPRPSPSGSATAPGGPGGGSSAPGGGGDGSTPASPAKLEFVLPGPFDLSYAPGDVARSIGIMALIMILLGAPTPIFNSTLSANRKLIERWARRRLPAWLSRRLGAQPPRPEGGSKTIGRRLADLSHTWPGLVLYLLLATLVYSLLDSGFPGADGQRIYLSALLAIAIGTGVSQLPGERYVRERYHSRGTVDVALWTIVLAAGCVVITRLTGFQPGYVYGIIGGFTFTVALTKEDKGRMAFRGMGFLLIVGVAAWFLRIPFQPTNGIIGGDLGSIANHILAGMFVGAVQGSAIALIPLRFLAGDRILAASRLRWLGLWAISLLLLAHVLLYPVSSFTPHPSETGLWTTIAVVVVYFSIALGFWWFFRQRAVRRDRRRVRAGGVPAPVPSTDDSPGTA